ncbi:MAG: Uma2 family endonuclease, partial [Verrucomicrobiota bacterium]
MSANVVESAAAEPIEAELVDYEKERGKPMPSPAHGLIQSRIDRQIAKHEEFDALQELTVDFTGNRPYYVPDICIYPKGKFGILDTEVRATDPPITAIEIL